jgi:peptidoglycan/LPS O-acetylase OafA/YrhL
MRTHLPERNLDLLRAVAVLCVLLDHLLTTWSRELPFVTNWELGRAGVLLFFVHTSLVLMSSLERQGDRRDWVRAFYTRRAFRIYPLAIATILGVVLFAVPPHVLPRGTVSAPVDPTPSVVIANIALVQNILGRPDVLGVLWTLTLEVQMYLALPYAFLLARRGVLVAIAGLAGAGALGLTVQYADLPGLWRLSVATFGPCFMSGVLAYAILRMHPRPALPAWTWVPLLIACLPLLHFLGANAASPDRGWPFCIAVGCSIPLVRELADSWLTRAAHVVCTYSYGIYLLHAPALWIAFTVLHNLPLSIQWATFGVLIVGLPFLAYRFLEAPAIGLGKRILQRPPMRGVVVPQSV